MELIFQLFTEGLPYFLLYILLFVFALAETSQELRYYKNVFAWLTFILLSLFTGLRWETGTDWPPYQELWETLELNWNFLLNVYSFDLGYVLLNAVVKVFSSDYTVFLLIDSFLAVGLVFAFLLKNSPNPNLSFFVFYNAFFVSQFMGSNRRIISLGAVLFLFYYTFEGKKKLVAWWQLLAFLFHRSSFLMFLSSFIPKKRFSGKLIFILLSTTLVAGLFQVPFKLIGTIGTSLSSFASNPIIERMLFYSENQENIVVGNTNPAVIMTLSVIKRSIFLGFYLVVISRNNGKLDSFTNFLFNIYLCGFAIYMALNGSLIFQMISTYFTFIEIVLIGRFWQYTEPKLKKYFLVILFIYGFFQLLSALSAYPELYMPYKSFLSRF